MDDRQRGVEIGAGLQESRLNTELIDFLQKWGPRILYALLAIVLVYVGMNWWRGEQDRTLAEAFAEYEAAKATGSPQALLAVADKFPGRAAIADIARLEAAGALLQAGSFGIAPGGDPFDPAPEDLLSDDDRRAMIERAEGLAQGVLDATRNNPDRARFAQSARWQLVSIRLSLGDTDGANAALAEFLEKGAELGFASDEMIGVERRGLIADATPAVSLPTIDDLPESARPTNLPAAPSPQLGPGVGGLGGGPRITGEDGSPIQIQQLTQEQVEAMQRQQQQDQQGPPAPPQGP